MALQFRATVAELKARMSLEEFRHWCAWWRVEGWGEAREDERTALICATVAATVAKKPPRFADFLPDFWNERKAEKRKQTPAEQKQILMMAVQAATAGK